MNLTSWDLSNPVQVLIVSQTVVMGFLIGSLVVVNCIYKPWLKNILDNDSSNKIKISTASFTPLADVLYMFSKEDIERIKFIGTNSKDKADYIYTNYIYEVDIRYNKKYKIPENFYLFKSVIKDGTLIYSIYV